MKSLVNEALLVRVMALAVVAAVNFLAGCGQDDSGSDKEPPPEIVAVDAVSMACEEGRCLWLVTAQVDRQYSAADYELVVTGQPGLVTPWACEAWNVVPFGDKLAAGVRDVAATEISWRVCVWDKGAGTYSAGFVHQTVKE